MESAYSDSEEDSSRSENAFGSENGSEDGSENGTDHGSEEGSETQTQKRDGPESAWRPKEWRDQEEARRGAALGRDGEAAFKGAFASP